MRHSSATGAFQYAALSLGAASALHIAGIFVGADMIAFLGAPPETVASFRAGTAQGPAITAFIALVLASTGFLAWRMRAAKAGKFIRLILGLFSAIFILRGLGFALFWMPEIKNYFGPGPVKYWFHFGASLFVLSIGLALAAGLYKTRRT